MNPTFTGRMRWCFCNSKRKLFEVRISRSPCLPCVVHAQFTHRPLKSALTWIISYLVIQLSINNWTLDKKGIMQLMFVQYFGCIYNLIELYFLYFSSSLIASYWYFLKFSAVTSPTCLFVVSSSIFNPNFIFRRAISLHPSPNHSMKISSGWATGRHYFLIENVSVSNLSVVFRILCLGDG